MKYLTPLILVMISHLLIYDRIPLQFDELLMYEVISTYSYSDMIGFLYLKEIQQPLGYIISKMAYSVSEATSFMRLPSLLMTLILPFVLYRLARLRLKKNDSLKASALLLAFLPVMHFSGSMRPYLAYLLFATFAFYNFLNPQRKLYLLIISLTALFFIHPFGSLLSLVLAAFSFLKDRRHPRIAVSMSIIGLGLIGTILFLRKSEIVFMITQFNGLKEYGEAIYNYSYLISGREFFIFLCILGIVYLDKKYRKKIEVFVPDKFWLYCFVWSGLSAVFLMIFLGKHVYPRHYIYVLPGIAIITIQLINSASEKVWVRNSLFGFCLIIFFYKAFGRESLHVKPYEIDSESISKKAAELAGNQIAISSCGNCFRYYIRDRSLICMGSSFQEETLLNHNRVVFIELNYVKNKCALDKMKRPFQIEESHQFIGGRVVRISF